MRKQIVAFAIILFALFAVKGYAQDKAYKDGSVWAITFIRTNTGMGDDYLKDLKSTWKGIHEEAQKQGLINSYKILQGMRSNPDDWDIMILVEYKNLAALENADDKWTAIYKSKIGDDAAQKKVMDNRSSVRTIYGEKILREVIYQ